MQLSIRDLRIIPALTVLMTLGACAINPVTGERELVLVSQSREVAMGEQNYQPGRQMYGGDYILEPSITAYVNRVGQRVAAVSDRALPYEFVVINDSTPNAWAMPGGKIAVHRGLLTELGSEAELAAVLGHEVVHAAARHGAQSMERGLLTQVAMVGVGMAAQDTDYRELVGLGAGVAASLIQSGYGRDAERESDHYGTIYLSRAGYDPQAAVELQETFVRLSEGRNQSWLDGLFASHPPSPERVRNNRETVASLPPGGEIGREAYAAAMAPLVRHAPAYASYDLGREALAAGRNREAVTHADEAIRLLPQESLFHTLKGEALLAMGDEDAAATAHARSIELNDNYFLPLLRHGLYLKARGQTQQARYELERSVALLPTAAGLNALGQDALAAGNSARAASLFEAAARDDSAAGRSAQLSLYRLRLPENPGQYLAVRALLDAEGRIVLEVANATPVAVTGLAIAVSIPTATGTHQEIINRNQLVIPSGNRLAIPTRLGPLPEDYTAAHVQAAVVRARVVD